LDTTPLIRTFESAKEELSKLRKTFNRKIEDFEDNMQAAEATYKTKNAEVGESLEVCLLDFYIQNLIMIIVILYIIKSLLDFYLNEKKSKNLVIIKTYRTLFGIMIAINTIFNCNNYIITGIINIISLCLLFNNYHVMICNSFTNS
jgi:hypothetical protein